MRFAYTRRGGPLLDWSSPTPPYQSRSGETRSLGSLELHVPRPGAPEIISGYESPHPNAALIHFGADAAPVDTGRLIRRVSALAAGYHGVRRNNGSIFWGLVWALAAFVSPVNGVLVPLFGAAQGFAQARPRSNPARAKRRLTAGRKRARTVAASPRARKEAAHQRKLAKLWREERPSWIRRSGKRFVVLNPSSRRRRRRR